MAVIPNPNLNAGGPFESPEQKQMLGGAGLEFPQVLPGQQVSTPLDAQRRRVYAIDQLTRKVAQRNKDIGLSQRPAVGPVEYAESNIKKSNQITGVAGYQHRPDEIPIPNSPDDMDQVQYMSSVAYATPERTQAFRLAVSNLRQNFLNTPDIAQQQYPDSNNMKNNLLNISRIKSGIGLTPEVFGKLA